MAVVRNRSAHWFDITGGGWIAADAEQNIDISHAHEQEAISRGVLIVVDPTVEPPPTPAEWTWPPGFHAYDPNYPGHTWDYYLDRPPEPEDLSQIDDQLLAVTHRLEAAIIGLDILPPVRAATTAPLATLNSLQTVDGVALASGDRVLLKNQSDATQNGVYDVSSGNWVRSSDADTGAELHTGVFVFVNEGTLNKSTGWVMSTSGTTVIGTSAINWTQFSGAGLITAGAGMTKTNNTLDVGAGSGIVVNPDTVAIDPAVVPTLSAVPLLAPADDLKNTFSGSSGRLLISGKVTADAQPRFTIDASGKLSWGDGTAAPDSTFVRVSALRFQINSVLRSTRVGASSSCFECVVSGEANMRHIIGTDGKLSWGDGTNPVDTTLYRNGANALKTDGQLDAVSNIVAKSGIASKVVVGDTGGSQAGLLLGSGGDVNIFRSAADRLRTNDLFIADLGVQTKTKAGAPVDADWAVAPADGTLAVDTTGNALYFRSGGAWKASGGGGAVSIAKILAVA